ncbi:MAG: FAD-binding oxidoreductase [Candidatus Pacearchaeota archaeon]
MLIKIFESKLLGVKKLNKTVIELRFSLPKDFKFKAGQYLSLSMIINGKKIRKPYSISSIPGENLGSFCIKLVQGGEGSSFLKKLKKGDKIELFGPAGKFIVDEKSKKKDLIFISTGTGISAFKSMIPDLLINQNFKNKIILIKGFRNEGRNLYDREFLALSKKFKNFEFFNIFSRPKSKNFERKGRVQNFIFKISPRNFSGDFYLCGLEEMIKSVSKKLKEKSIKEERIFFEKYN